MPLSVTGCPPEYTITFSLHVSLVSSWLCVIVFQSIFKDLDSFEAQGLGTGEEHRLEWPSIGIIKH